METVSELELVTEGVPNTGAVGGLMSRFSVMSMGYQRKTPH
jgi:hypothetical protein